jgi:hypothetical protein
VAENKTPYEIRLEILKISKELLMESFYQQRETERSNWDVNSQIAKLENKPLPLLKYVSTFPTEDQIIEKAKKLNDFVSNK